MFRIISLPFISLQRFVDSLAMYRVVSLTLGLLAIISIGFGFIGLIPFSGQSQLISLASAIIVALLLNVIISGVFKIDANHESAFITALILFFLALPEETLLATWPLLAAVAIAIISKFVLVYKKQHFLNPAALGAAVISVTGLYTFSWWVANPSLFIPLVILGGLVVMKLRKWAPVLAFIAVSLIIFIAESLSYGEAVTASLRTFLLSWPTLFLAFFMLTEPFTMPSQKGPQFLYGGIVGFLSNSSIFSPFVSFTPELALVVANIIMVPFRQRQKLFLVLKNKITIANNTFEFIFEKPKGFTFQAGQYLEWMLPHKKSDSRGIRRYFTIASSPTEPDIRVAMKIITGGSSYKAALETLDTGGKVIASQLAGDFVLPKDTTKKLAFIAGGIGITPFRSHIQYMKDSGLSHDTVLYFCNKTQSEVVYQDLFEVAAASFPLEVIQVIQTEQYPAPYEYGYVTSEMVKRRTPDYLERHWYISGPPGMVNAYAELLSRIGVPGKQITKDFFPGLA